MKAFVFTDKALERQAGRFVWLDIDTEKSKNAGVRKRLQIQALPTFFIVNPVDEKVVLRWVGGASRPQLERILEDGRLAVVGGARAGAPMAGGGAASAAADRALAQADRLYGEGDNVEAAKAYQEALRLAPEDWSRYGRTVESLLFALSQTEDYEVAAKLARDSYPRLKRTSSSANVAATGLDCALSLPSENPLRKELVETLEGAAREVLADSTIPLAADDRSGIYGTLVSAREDAKDDSGAKRTASDWGSYLEGEASRARTPEERTVFDSHRLAAYIEIGEAERAIRMLEASERDFPNDYNPPARLAAAYKAMKRWDEALAASDRALAKVYGPRKLRVLQDRADIYVGRGETTSARRTLEEAVATAESLPLGQRSEGAIAALRKKLEALP